MYIHTYTYIFYIEYAYAANNLALKLMNLSDLLLHFFDLPTSGAQAGSCCRQCHVEKRTVQQEKESYDERESAHARESK